MSSDLRAMLFLLLLVGCGRALAADNEKKQETKSDKGQSEEKKETKSDKSQPEEKKQETKSDKDKVATDDKRGGRKLALLVGISKYRRGPQDDQNGWWDLNAQTDLDELRRVLTNQRYGFAPLDIVELTDEKATRQGIIDAFTRHLIQQARPGDVVVFHFSGHGQQVADQSGALGDEIDGLDESLVPYDYVTQSARDGAKTNLRDDTLGELLQSLAKKMRRPDGKLDGSITVLLDTCFSGSATRGRQGRGRGWDEAQDGPRPAGSGGAEAGVFTRGAPEAAGYVVLTAAQSDQVANERMGHGKRRMGAFTYHLTEALLSGTPPSTYRALFDRLSIVVPGEFRQQYPQAEGDLDKKVFAGLIEPVSPYLLVEEAEAGRITLPIGEIHGATPRSRFDLFRAGSDVRKERRLAEAELTEVLPTRSRAQLTAEYRGKVKGADLLAARAVEAVHVYSKLQEPLRVCAPAVALPALRRTGTGSKVIEVKGEGDRSCEVRLTREGDDLLAKRQDGSLLGRWPMQPAPVDPLRDALQGEWRWRYLSQLQNRSSYQPLKIEVRPVQMEVLEMDGQQVKRARESKVAAVQGLSFKAGDFIGLQLRNSSGRPVYASVLELAPDGSITAIYPSADQRGVRDNVIAPGDQWQTLPLPYVFRLVPPGGRSLIKVIATTEPADFSSVCSQPPRVSRGDALRGLPPRATPLGALLLDAVQGQRNMQKAALDPAYWTAATASFLLRAPAK